MYKYINTLHWMSWNSCNTCSRLEVLVRRTVVAKNMANSSANILEVTAHTLSAQMNTRLISPENMTTGVRTAQTGIDAPDRGVMLMLCKEIS